MIDLDRVTGQIVDAALKIHQRLGPGLLESVYEAVLAKELERRGLRVHRQLAVPLEIDGIRFDETFRIDLLVNDSIVVELKSIEKLAPVHAKRLLTYLRLLGLPVGLLINFGGLTLREGLQRIVNAYRPSSDSVLGVNRLPLAPIRAETRATPPTPEPTRKTR